MEEETFKRIKSLFCYQQDSDVMFCPGGSFSNMQAIHFARFNYDEDINSKGVYKSKKFKIYVSENSHYSFEKGLSFLGLGYSSLIKIPCNKKTGSMIIEKLEEAISKNDEDSVPLMVVATAGSTVLGSFDNIEEISKICKKYKIWFHIDAAFGGSVIFSRKYKHLLKGVENSDSLVWNPHKMLRIPLQCSLLLIKDGSIPKKCNSINVNYLFQKDKFYDTNLDSGTKYIQCGRRCDILKLWMTWRIRGEEVFENEIDKIYDIANSFKKKIEQNPNFELILENNQCTNICFQYINKTLRFNMDKVCLKIKKEMLKEGKIMISYQKLESINPYNFFRIVFINPSLKNDDLDYIIKKIDYYGQNL